MDPWLIRRYRALGAIIALFVTVALIVTVVVAVVLLRDGSTTARYIAYVLLAGVAGLLVLIAGPRVREPGDHR